MTKDIPASGLYWTETTEVMRLIGRLIIAEISRLAEFDSTIVQDK
jgi:hypothetical protein